MSENDLHHRESEFHDGWADSTPLESISPEKFFESPTALENAFLLTLIPDFTNLKVLDVGCGLGESSVYFAKRGAEVTAMDLSPQMVKLTETLAAHHGISLTGLAHAGETLPLPDDQFDFVYLANIIHHVHDRDALLSEIRRVLKPGGMFFSWDPVAYNPAVNIYRRMATEVRTPDEQPLTTADLTRVRKYFPDVRSRTTWLLTLSIFFKYYLIDRHHPNDVRYWKHVLEETPQSLWWWRPLAQLDEWLTRIPGLRWLTWNISLWGTKPDPDSTKK